MVIKMNELIEIEYKILLTQEIYQKIKQYYQDQITRDYIQTNYYLTHPLLQEKKYMLRIREKNNTYELTLKRPYQHHQIETNVPLTKEQKAKILQHQPIQNEIIDILIQEGINPLELQNQYSLTTHRCDIELKEGILSLDKNTYCQQQDYELEFEVYHEQEGYQKFLEIIQPFSLHYTQNCPSKIQRVLNSL